MTTLEAYDNVLMALCIWREARGESREAKIGVKHVILNRLADKRWPKTLPAVILQTLQFSSFNSNDPNAVKFPMADSLSFADCCLIVDAADPDPTKGANHYHSISDAAKFPKWAHPSKQTAQIGAFRFYRL